MKRFATIFFLFLILTLIATESAYAQQKRQRTPRVIQLEEITIEGKVQKPNAFYILNRSNIGYEIMDLRTSFLGKVVGAVNQEPF
ncbi:MAG: hypothetical protein JXA30_12895 [Deltaproteobacteria bacterium]|nr:hypothetical protein [Deltaproteobacteria bacterium]